MSAGDALPREDRVRAEELVERLKEEAERALRRRRLREARSAINAAMDLGGEDRPDLADLRERWFALRERLARRKRVGNVLALVVAGASCVAAVAAGTLLGWSEDGIQAAAIAALAGTLGGAHLLFPVLRRRTWRHVRFRLPPRGSAPDDHWRPSPAERWRAAIRDEKRNPWRDPTDWR